VAGWGDIAIGATALPIALWVTKQPDTARGALFIWNSLGLADLVIAVSLGALSAPGAIRVFFDDPSSALIASIPWILIPCFLVPSLSFVHLVVFYRMLGARAAVNSAVLSSAP
jgi:hypothetical protein